MRCDGASRPFFSGANLAARSGRENLPGSRWCVCVFGGDTEQDSGLSVCECAASSPYLSCDILRKKTKLFQKL